MDELKLSEYYIAYIDVLGYTELMEKHGEQRFLEILDKAYKYVIDKLNILFSPGSVSISYKYSHKIFSDNIVICVPAISGELRHLGMLVAELQRHLLVESEIIIRGAITQGNLYINDNFIFGKGLVRAYELENKIALYPRIIVDKRISDIEEKMLMVLLDNDGCYYLHYLESFCLSNLNRTEDFEQLKIQSYKKHMRIIIENLEKYIDNDRIYQKYQWCKTYHNRVSNFYNDREMLLIQ